MFKPPDPPYIQKLNRAHQQFESLRTALEDFVKANPCPTEEKVDPKSKQRVWRVSGPVPDPNVLWSPLFGEFLFNARSSLDQLIYAVVKRARWGGAPHGRLLYPIYTDAVEFLCNMREPLKSLPSDVLTIIEGSQPYNGSISPKYHSLALLNKLCNIDKHRRPNLTVYSVRGFGTYGDFPWDTTPVHLGPVKEGTVLLTLPEAMNVGFVPTFDISFAEGEASYTPAKYVLLLIVNSVSNIVAQLDPFVRQFGQFGPIA